jgi:hypothetical protein
MFHDLTLLPQNADEAITQDTVYPGADVGTRREAALRGERVHRRVMNEIICRSPGARQRKRLDAQLRQRGHEICMEVIVHWLLLGRRDMLLPIMSDVLTRPADARQWRLARGQRCRSGWPPWVSRLQCAC